jgi:hypothetical protein
MSSFSRNGRKERIDKMKKTDGGDWMRGDGCAVGM